MAEEEIVEIDLVQLRKMKVCVCRLQSVRHSCVARWQVPEVRKQAAELGLESKGTKAEILARIEKYVKEQGTHPASPRRCTSVALLNRLRNMVRLSIFYTEEEDLLEEEEEGVVEGQEDEEEKKPTAAVAQEPPPATKATTPPPPETKTEQPATTEAAAARRVSLDGEGGGGGGGLTPQEVSAVYSKNLKLFSCVHVCVSLHVRTYV